VHPAGGPGKELAGQITGYCLQDLPVLFSAFPDNADHSAKDDYGSDGDVRFRTKLGAVICCLRPARKSHSKSQRGEASGDTRLVEVGGMIARDDLMRITVADVRASRVFKILAGAVVSPGLLSRAGR
jgi:hypothetical protein